MVFKVNIGVATHAEPGFYPESTDQTARNRRDYFAAKAMLGLLACPKSDTQMVEENGGGNLNAGLAISAYDIADAMMIARNKPKI